MKYDAILFDAAETLFTTRGSVGEIYGTVAREYGSRAATEDIQSAFAREFNQSGPLSANDEKKWWRDIVHRVFSDVGMFDRFDEFFERVYDQFRDSRGWLLFPETREVLTELRSRGYKLGIISNFDSRVYGVLTSLDIHHFFDAISISSETGYAKPHAGIFRAAVRALGTPPNRILVVGDNLMDDVQAARLTGLDSVLVDRRDRYASLTAYPKIKDLRGVFALLDDKPKAR